MSVFVLRALGIGDLATAVPALRALRAAYPNRPLELGAPDWLAPLAALTGAVDRVLPVDGLPAAGASLPVVAPMVAVNLHGRGPQSHRALLATGPGELLAFASAEAGTAGPPWRADEHEVDRWCRMLAWYDICAHPGDLLLHRPEAPAPVTGAAIVHPGAKDPARRWPAARFAAVARALRRAGHDVVVTGSGADVAAATRIAHAAGLGSDRVLAGRTGLAELAALVAGARLVVSGDTGVAHLAVGYRTPSVTLFHTMSPALWGPPADAPMHRALWHGEHRDPLAHVTVGQVLDAAAEVMTVTDTRHRAGAPGGAGRRDRLRPRLETDVRTPLDEHESRIVL